MVFVGSARGGHRRLRVTCHILGAQGRPGLQCDKRRQYLYFCTSGKMEIKPREQMMVQEKKKHNNFKEDLLI